MVTPADSSDIAPSPVPAGRVTYRVVHETRYEYANAILGGLQLAHLSPRATSWQSVRAHHLEIDPEPTERSEGLDYFGNRIVRFGVEGLHSELTVRADSIVEITRHAPAANTASPPWEHALARDGLWSPEKDLEIAQYRVESALVPVLPEALEYARDIFAPERPWLDALTLLTRRIKQDFVYDPAATTVTTPVSEVFTHRRGVCQDFAHLMLSCLRSLGLSARYVSGYILNRPPPGKEKLAGSDASHAWVAAHCPGLGWVGFDPTNGKLADIEFITVSWGREFSDVTPLRGVVLGSGEQELTVSVTVEPLEASGPDP